MNEPRYLERDFRGGLGRLLYVVNGLAVSYERTGLVWQWIEMRKPMLDGKHFGERMFLN